MARHITKEQYATCILNIYCDANKDQPFYVCCHDCEIPCRLKCRNSQDRCGCYYIMHDTITEWRNEEIKLKARGE